MKGKTGRENVMREKRKVELTVINGSQRGKRELIVIQQEEREKKNRSEKKGERKKEIMK